LEVVKTSVKLDPSLGIELTELANGSDHQGLVLVSGVYGNAAQADPRIEVGDLITGVFAGGSYKERTTALDYDLTVQAINEAKEHSLDMASITHSNSIVW
jgi:hypothetical protein